MNIVNHKLENIAYIKSPNVGGVIDPTAIIIHYTAGSSSESDIKQLTSIDSKVSAHIVIGEDGDITQLVPFNIKAWHAGESEYNGIKHLNNWSVGIELSNWGPLVYKNNEYYCWPDKYNLKYNGAEPVYKGRHKNLNCELPHD